MIISGLVKSSLIDYPDKIAAVVFTSGCNFRCGFCHNPELVIPGKEASFINEDDFFIFLKSRQGKLDGVVVTGGEPTVHKEELIFFLKKIKALGFLVKLDTNGSNPEVIRDILNQKLADYVAMDIKNSEEKYQLTSGFYDLGKIKTSINLIMHSGLNYEFRTTVLPTFHTIQDVRGIGRLINGSERYVIQGFRPGETLDPSLSRAKAFSREELADFAAVAEKYARKVEVHDNY